jgi:guanylate kinase
MRKTLHLIPGISGSGKTYMGRYMEKCFSQDGINSKLVVPHTTRPPRPDEIHGVDYYFHDVNDFEKTISPNMKGGDGWRYSKIGEHYYFNSDIATLPTDEIPLAILPVAFYSLDEVVRDYNNISKDIDIMIIPIAINELIRNSWHKKMQHLRASRDLNKELEEQDKTIKESKLFDDVYYTKWNKEEDVFCYMSLFKKIQSKRGGSNLWPSIK